jgi:glycosyltransferase involved in cell wall biosynthesis
MLLKAFVSLQKQTLTRFEVIIVDNGPFENDTRKLVMELMREDPRIIYVNLTNGNLETARNVGCSISRSDVVLLTDDDWEMTNPVSLQYIVDRFTNDLQLGVLGISHDYAASYPTTTWKARIRLLLSRLYKPGKISRWGRVTARFYALPAGQRYNVDHVRGCCLSFRRVVGNDAGLFPTLYVYKGIGYRSETEFCRRVAQKGYKVVFSSEILGIHKVSNRSASIMPRFQTLEKMRYLARAHLLFMLRNYWSPLTAPIFALLDLLIGNSSQPGAIRLLISFRYFGKINIVSASVQGQWQGIIEYYTKYHDIITNT